MIAPLEDSLTVRNYVITKSSLDYNVVFIHFCEQLCSKCILNSGFSIKEFRKFTENSKKVQAAFLPEPFFMVPFIYGNNYDGRSNGCTEHFRIITEFSYQKLALQYGKVPL